MVDTAQLIDVLKRAQDLAFEVIEPLQPVAFAKLFDLLLIEKQAPASSTGAVSPSSANVPAAFNEFHALKAPRDHVSRVAAIAFHALHTSPSDPRIGTADIIAAYGSVREKKPQNIPDVIKQAVRRGLLVTTEPKDARKTWAITPTGEKYVSDGFQRNT